MKKKKGKNELKKDERFFKIAYVVIAILIVVLLGTICFAMLSHKSLKKLDVQVLETQNNKGACVTIYAEENNEIVEYTFNDGLTWQKSNYSILCSNEEITVFGRNEKEEIIAEGTIKVETLKEEAPTINIDFDTDINSLEKEDLLYGVTAKDSANNNISEIETNVSLSEDGKYNIIEYSVSDKKGNTTTVIRKEEIKNETITLETETTISFDKIKYSCEAGEKISTNITVSNINDRVESYNSSDLSIATIEKHPTLTAKSPQVATVQIKCIKNGNITLSAKSAKGAKTESQLVVTGEILQEIGKINFEKESYNCNAGDTISTIITAITNNGTSTVQSYKSSNTSIATIEKDPEMALKCINCVAVKIKCLKSGATTLTATSSTGATTSSNLKVAAPDKGIIEFDKTSYTCSAGEKISASISASSSNLNTTVKSYNSSNTSIATIEKHPSISIKSPNAVAVQINCIKEGTVTLNATSSTGATTSSKLKVNAQLQDLGTIEFAKTNYTCAAGEEISTIITAKSNNDKATVKSYVSDNTSIATIEKDPNVAVKCINCVAVRIKCKASGTVTLTSTSSTGATANSKVTVAKADLGSIAFDKTSYTCTEGEKITTNITATSNDLSARVASYKSGNTSIVTIEKHPNITAKSPQVVTVQVNCISEGQATLLATSSKGITTSVRIIVKKADSGSIKFEQTSYNCTPGKELSTIITASSLDNTATVQSYKSNNTSIATIEKDPNQAVKCINCVAVRIKCIKSGKATLTATSSKGATTTTVVNVANNDKGTINYEKSSYSCIAGKEISTIITAESEDNTARVQSYKSNNTSIATVEKDPNIAVKCINCVAVRIKCIKSGETTLTATSSKGATTTSSISVSSDNKGIIYFDENQYTCKVGEKITTLIQTKTNGDVISTVKSFKSNDTAIATINYHPELAVSCIDCTATQIVCKKAGTTSFTAVSSTGAVGMATITVTAANKDLNGEIELPTNLLQNIVDNILEVFK